MSESSKLAIGDAIPFPFREPAQVRDQVILKAQKLIEACRNKFPEWSPPPFDPGFYARALDLPLFYSDELGDWDALFVPVGEKPRIILNSGVASEGRRRFSLAHEIAHSWFDAAGKTYFMRSAKKAKYYRDESSRQLERACDLGAAELLMPRPWFIDTVKAHGFRAATVPRLAERYAVSFQASALRLLETRRKPSAVGFFTFTTRPSAKKDKTCSASVSPETNAYRARRVFRSMGFPYLFPQAKSVPDTSVIYQASLQDDELEAEEIFTLGRNKAQLRVSAFPLHPKGCAGGPPEVCAVFTVADQD